MEREIILEYCCLSSTIFSTRNISMVGLVAPERSTELILYALF